MRPYIYCDVDAAKKFVSHAATTHHTRRTMRTTLALVPANYAMFGRCASDGAAIPSLADCTSIVAAALSAFGKPRVIAKAKPALRTLVSSVRCVKVHASGTGV